MSLKPEFREGVDWLAVAIDSLGGVASAAQQVGVTRAALYKWLQKGLGSARFDIVVRLATMSKIPVNAFETRLGEYPGAGD